MVSKFVEPELIEAKADLGRFESCGKEQPIQTSMQHPKLHMQACMCFFFFLNARLPVIYTHMLVREHTFSRSQKHLDT